MLLKLFFIIIGLCFISQALATQCRDGSYCPGRQTCCLAIYGVGCCPYENAICCGDGVHCCPNGFICGDYSCYKTSGDANLAFFLSNTKQNNFLDNKNNPLESKENNKAESAEAQSSDKINKTFINFSLNTRINPDTSVENENNSNANNKNLEFLETNISNEPEKTIINASSSTTSTTTTVKEEKSGLISSSIVSMSKFTAILDKLDFLNNSYFKKLLGCFTDMEPLIKDLMKAYKQKSESKTESLMKLVTELVSKVYFDGAKITNDCKALLALAGIAGLV